MKKWVAVVVVEGCCCYIKQLVPSKFCFPIWDMAEKQGRQCTDLWPFSDNLLVGAATPFI